MKELINFYIECITDAAANLPNQEPEDQAATFKDIIFYCKNSLEYLKKDV